MENLKIGDLVETCAMHPGFVTSIDDDDDVTVFVPTKLAEYFTIHGGHHSIKHCGVHKISTEYAMMLFSFTEKELTDMYTNADFENTTWEDIVRDAYNKKLNKK